MTTHKTCTTDTLETPIGPILAAVDAEGALVCLDFLDSTAGAAAAEARLATEGWNIEHGPNAAIDRVRDQLDGYFRGERRDFDLPLAPAGTDFQRKTWQALCDIPYGTTISYAELAARSFEKIALEA